VIRLEDLDYALPPERIAQRPLRCRDDARLLTLDRASGELGELRFGDLPEHLRPADLLVVNDTRVVPAKLRGRKASGGLAEALLLERRPDGCWRALVRTRGRLREGLELQFAELRATVASLEEGGACTLRFDRPDEARLARIGEAPLPPYIRRPEPRKEDLEDYQSVFARVPGAVAAPTASLHFSAELAERLSAATATLTLHVGPGTFKPIRSATLEGHALDPERFEIPEATAAAIAETRARGGRVIAVGTTVVRALETTGGEAGCGSTSLFVRPGYAFRVVDSLITNFHLPRSSLLALVMAFAGVEPVRAAYRFAIEAGFRFYSYGDAMWIR
jgi:S-adenosylmethionine:tRNA ribosyltransferase-isomerase